MNATGLVLLGILVLLTGGALAAGCARVRGLCLGLFLASSLGGCVLAAVAGLQVLLAGAVQDWVVDWNVPAGGFHARLDALGAWYALVVGLIGAPIAVYATFHFEHASRGTLAVLAFLFNLLLGSLLLLAAAGHALLFLAAWEVATISAYFLIVLFHEKEEIRRAGRIYLFANHTGTFCLVALIALLGAGAGSLEFSALSGSARFLPASGLLLPLALIGFGTKAGILPLHIWLPHAHPAAPSPISALLSGIVIKAGIFGLLRFLAFLPPVSVSWGVVLLVLGVLSGVLGVLYALSQHDLKKLLAYHSVENIGIILIGIGVGLVGARTGSGLVAVLGFAGALLHLLNHAAFKSLLFLGAGRVVHATGTGAIDHLGGLARRMPATALLFLVGCVSICALPPFNGFVSEWSVFRAMFEQSTRGAGTAALWSVGGILGLALIGGLAAACFAKVFGAVFLGEPRARHDHGEARDAPGPQKVAMGFLALLCLLIGILPQLAIRVVWPACVQVAQSVGAQDIPDPGPVAAWLGSVSSIGLAFLSLVLAIALLSRLLLRRPSVHVGTWGCGYARPSARMQYTASSFADPLLRVFRGVLYPRIDSSRGRGSFSGSPALRSRTPDAAETWIFRPAFALLMRACAPARFLQRVPVQYQVSVVVAVLTLLLLWKVTL
jgi:hydrogenase-4 component B